MTPGDRLARVRQDLLALRGELQAVLDRDRTRSRGAAVRQLHEVMSMLDPAAGFASQAGQDRVVARLFGGKRDGIFVDIGAYDGITGSNTLYFERALGWSGILVEPVAAHRARAEAVRRTPCLPYAVAARDGAARFIAVEAGFTQMSGLAETYDPALLTRVRNDPRHREAEIEVETRTIAQIFAEAGLNRADFVSLDIEGGELAALSAFPFGELPVTCWAIENNSGSGDIAALMRDRGYELIEFCGPDEIYRLRD